MLEAVARLGAFSGRQHRPAGIERYARLSPEEQHALVALVEPPKATHVVAIVFTQGPPTRYVGCRVEQLEAGEPLRYLYRSGPSQGPLNLPYGIVTDAGKVWKNRFVSWFAELERELPNYDTSLLSSAGRELLSSLPTAFRQHQVQAAEELAEKVKAGGSKPTFFASLAFQDGGTLRYLGSPDLPFYRHLLQRNARRLVADKGARMGHCSVCGTEAEVSGHLGADVFKFATFDKPGYVAGGLDVALAWRNFPLCYRCYLHLEQGRAFIEKHLVRNFQGLRYWLVPRFTAPSASDALVQELFQIFQDPSARKRQDVGRPTRRILEPQEDDLLVALSEQGDYLSLQFVFLEKARSRERVLLAIEDVLPSRLRELFDAKERVERRAHGAGWLDASANWEYTLGGSLQPFFRVDRGQGRQPELRRKEFLDVVDAIFRGVPIERHYLLVRMMERIRDRFMVMASGNDPNGYWDFHRAVRDALFTVMFVAGLGLLRLEEPPLEKSMAEPVDQSDPFIDYLDQFFEEHKPAFPNEGAKAVFLLGGLTAMLLQLQRRRYNGSTPFYKQLKSLRMSQRDVVALLPDVQDKMVQYDALSGRRRRTAEAASAYFIRAGLGPWGLGTDELNFVFALGMNLQDLLWKKLEPESAEDE